MNSTLNLAEAAEFLKLHPATVAARARDGTIPAYKPGRALVFLQEELEEYLRKCRFTDAKGVRIGGSASVSLAEKLAAQRAQRNAGRQRRDHRQEGES